MSIVSYPGSLLLEETQNYLTPSYTVFGSVTINRQADVVEIVCNRLHRLLTCQKDSSLETLGKAMRITHVSIVTIKLLLLLCLLSACRSEVHQLDPLPTVVVNPNFQRQLDPLPTIPSYRCGAWASDNTPAAASTITIYAKLTGDVAGVPDIPATAIVHFKSANITLDQQAVSDGNGYVSFTLPLQGRQPRLIPATVDVHFATIGSPVRCTAFFTPQ